MSRIARSSVLLGFVFSLLLAACEASPGASHGPAGPAPDEVAPDEVAPDEVAPDDTPSAAAAHRQTTARLDVPPGLVLPDGLQLVGTVHEPDPDGLCVGVLGAVVDQDTAPVDLDWPSIELAFQLYAGVPYCFTVAMTFEDGTPSDLCVAPAPIPFTVPVSDPSYELVEFSMTCNAPEGALYAWGGLSVSSLRFDGPPRCEHNDAFSLPSAFVCAAPVEDSDEDGGALTWSFEWVSHPELAVDEYAWLFNEGGGDFSFGTTAAGMHEIRIVVTNEKGARVRQTMPVRVRDDALRLPLALETTTLDFSDGAPGLASHFDSYAETEGGAVLDATGNELALVLADGDACLFTVSTDPSFALVAVSAVALIDADPTAIAVLAIKPFGDDAPLTFVGPPDEKILVIVEDGGGFNVEPAVSVTSVCP